MDQEIIIDAIKHNTAQQSRIADTLEEVLRLVKKDQEDAKKRMLAAADEGLKEHEETHD
jgi:hypothetical protein